MSLSGGGEWRGIREGVDIKLSIPKKFSTGRFGLGKVLVDRDDLEVAGVGLELHGLGRLDVGDELDLVGAKLAAELRLEPRLEVGQADRVELLVDELAVGELGSPCGA